MALESLSNLWGSSVAVSGHPGRRLPAEVTKGAMVDILNTQSDEALMARVARGYHDAFDVLVGRYQSAVMTFCYSFVRDHGRSEDLAQDTFLRVYKSAARYRPTAKFTTWLYKIAANLCINALKKGKLRRALSLDSPIGRDPDGSKIIEKIAADENIPLTEAEKNEAQKLLTEAIDHLPEEQRTTIVMVEYHCMPYKEIADILGVSVSAIKMRVKRARENLREMLKVLRQEG